MLLDDDDRSTVLEYDCEEETEEEVASVELAVDDSVLLKPELDGVEDAGTLLLDDDGESVLEYDSDEETEEVVGENVQEPDHVRDLLVAVDTEEDTEEETAEEELAVEDGSELLRLLLEADKDPAVLLLRDDCGLTVTYTVVVSVAVFAVVVAVASVRVWVAVPAVMV